MQCHFGVDSLRAEWPRAVGCVGTFDGVHCGHAAVIRQAVAEAREGDLPCVLVTFDRHPAAVLAPDRNPKTLAPLEENLSQFRALGVSVTVVLAFDATLSRMSADRFLRSILLGSVRATSLVVGHDFAMGNGREGTADWLQARVPTTIVAPFELGGERVSSSGIRNAVAAGEMERAKAHLGRPFTMSGVVVGGQQLGRTLGFPTANLGRSIDQVLPPDGVYAARFHVDGAAYAAALAIGTRPAVGGGDRSVEAFILDYPGTSIYGASVRIEVLSFIRGEENFPSLDALKTQMHADVAEVRQRLNRAPAV